MGENRSFDNMLGYLYTPDDPPPAGDFEGLAFGDYSNTAADGTVVPAHRYQGKTDRIMSQPDPDPGEEYPHVNTQLFGEQNAHNRGKDVDQMQHPYNAPAAGAQANMSGFVRDYETDFEGRTKRKPKAHERDQIMGSFDPGMLPVLSTLAKEFGVFDHWFCAVPSQTFCNRSFFHASTSHGFVTNSAGGGYKKWLDAAPTPTVFNRLEEAGISWRIYFDELQLVSFTGVLHAPVLEQFWRTERFASMQQFYQDVRDGTLPEYAFVEPRMIFNHNDFHPPVGRPEASEEDGEFVENGAYSDVRAGEALIHDIYSAVRTSTSKHGSNYLNTALLITFDEHGGTYDHVPPPAATPPDASGAGEMGFEFDRLGCRVPAIFVSAHTSRGSVFSKEMHHGSLAATLSERFVCGRSLDAIMMPPRSPTHSTWSVLDTSQTGRKPNHRMFLRTLSQVSIPQKHTRIGRSAHRHVGSSACCSNGMAVQKRNATHPRRSVKATTCWSRTGMGCSASTNPNRLFKATFLSVDRGR